MEPNWTRLGSGSLSLSQSSARSASRDVKIGSDQRVNQLSLSFELSIENKRTQSFIEVIVRQFHAKTFVYRIKILL